LPQTIDTIENKMFKKGIVMFLKKIVSLLLFVSLSVGYVSAEDDHNLTDTQLHAVLGIVTNFILSDDVIVHHGVRYKVVTSPYTGHKWLDRNLGASQVCTSFDDASCYGDYYQWGRNYDGHQVSSSGTTDTQAADVNNVGHGDFITSDDAHDYDWAQAVDGDGSLRSANWSKTDGSSICPLGYRVPTIDELRAELFDAGSAEIENRADAFNSFLKLPSAGARDVFDGSVFGAGWGYVWSSSASGSSVVSILHFYSDNALLYNYNFRAGGLSVRCLRD